MTKPAKAPKPIRTITDQVELIDWLVEQVKADNPEMIGIGTVRCFDAIALEFRYGTFGGLGACWSDYMDAVFENVTNQEEKARCSRNVQWLASNAIAHLIERGPNSSLAADYFIMALTQALNLEAGLHVQRVGQISRVTSAPRFQRRFGFKCDVRIERYRRTELYRQEVG